MASAQFQALTPQQVNSWPEATPQTTLAGTPLRYFGASSKEGFLELARERFKLCVDALGPQRREMLEDLNFAAGIQWDKAVENSRHAQKRPCLTINRVDGFLAHAVNSMRQTRPAIKIIAAADGADESIAEIKQGLLQHIQTNSNSDIASDQSFGDMTTMGLGWMRVVDDWASPESLDQELFIRWVPNVFSVYYDPFCKQPDWSDMRYCFIVEDLTRAEFKARFGGDTETASLNNFQGIGDQVQYWFPDERIRIAEYFHVEYDDDYVCELEDKSTRLLSKLPKGMYSIHRDDDGELACFLNDTEDEWSKGERIGRARECKVPKVYWALISALDVLKERKWKGRYIPMIPVIGNQIKLNGENILVGMTRYAREPQRMYNYMYTSFVETVALMPRAPFVAEVNQIPDGAMKEMWERANTDPQAVLLYKQFVDDQGHMAPPPQRNPATPDIAAFVQGLQMADQNLKSIFRIFDASLGQRGPQESGLAINARKVESDTGIYNWADNFVRALRFLGTVLDDLLPAYYNTPGRVFQITSDEDTSRLIVMNQQFKDPADGVVKQFDLSKGGKYAIVVSTGPSYQTKRQESAQNMLEFFKLNPAGLQGCADILVGEFDFPGKDRLRARLEKMLPPQLQEPDPNAPPMPPEVRTQMDQAMAQIQQLTQLLHAATDKQNEIRMKEEYETFRAKLKEDGNTLRAQMMAEVNLAAADLKAGNQAAQLLTQKIFDRLEHMEAQMLQKQAEDHAIALAQIPTPAAPSSAGPQTVGGQPSVGGA